MDGIIIIAFRGFLYGDQKSRNSHKKRGRKSVGKNTNWEVLGEAIMKHMMSFSPMTFLPYFSPECLYI